MDTYGQPRLDHAELPTAEDKTIYTRRAPVKVPLDLKEWFSVEQLLAWVLEALEQVGEVDPAHQAGSPDPRRAFLLTLLTLAYVTEQFRNTDILRACASDPVFGHLCAGKAPFKQELEHFRRANRQLLQTLLAFVLDRAVEKRFDLEPGAIPAGLKRDLLIRAEERMDIARHMNTIDD